MICFVAFFAFFFIHFGSIYSIAILKFWADNGFIGLFLDWLGVDFSLNIFILNFNVTCNTNIHTIIIYRIGTEA